MDLVVEETDVTIDRLIFHFRHVVESDDILVTGGGDVDITPAERILNRKNTETFHRSLESADRIDFGNNDLRTRTAKGLCTTLIDNDFTGDHHIGRALDTV